MSPTQTQAARAAELPLEEVPTASVEPFVAGWAESFADVPLSSTDMRSDDTGTWRGDTQEADT